MNNELYNSFDHNRRKRDIILGSLKNPYYGIRNIPTRLRILKKPPETTTPNMLRPIAHIAFWVMMAALFGIGLYIFLIPSLIGPKDSGLDAIQLVLAIMAGLGAVFLGVYAYRKQRLEEVASARDDNAQFLSRYNAATQQIADNKAAARLAGVYAMTRLADDWPVQRQQCVDVLCSYLRMPPTSNPGDEEVRSTILRVITERIRYQYHPHDWSNLSFNFDRAVFHNLDMSGGVFYGSEVSFQNVQFTGITNFSYADFGTRVRFDGASFTGPLLSFNFTSFRGNFASFRETKLFNEVTSFTGALFEVNGGRFDSAVFGGELTTFMGTEFYGGRISFDSAILKSRNSEFYATHFTGHVTFKGTQFVDTHATIEQTNLRDREPIGDYELPQPFDKVSLIKCDMRLDTRLGKHNAGLDRASIDKDSSITVETHSSVDLDAE